MSGTPDTELMISVIMPAFCAESTIEQAIQSVLMQTHQKFELIIVNDASADQTLRIAQEYARKDARIRVLNNPVNLGVANSRNRGVDVAKAGWIAFLDSDDMWHPRKLERQSQLVLSHPECPICFTGAAYVDESGSPYRYVLRVPSRLTARELLKQNLISCSSVLVQKEALQAYPMINDPLIHEDLATWLNILGHNGYAIGIDEPLLVYRLSGNSKSGNKFRAAQMQWRTYRIMGLNRLTAAACFGVYAWRNIRKYTLIQNSRDRKV